MNKIFKSRPDYEIIQLETVEVVYSKTMVHRDLLRLLTHNIQLDKDGYVMLGEGKGSPGHTHNS